MSTGKSIKSDITNIDNANVCDDFFRQAIRIGLLIVGNIILDGIGHSVRNEIDL